MGGRCEGRRNRRFSRKRIKKVVNEFWTNAVRQNRDFEVFDKLTLLIFDT